MCGTFPKKWRLMENGKEGNVEINVFIFSISRGYDETIKIK